MGNKVDNKFSFLLLQSLRELSLNNCLQYLKQSADSPQILVKLGLELRSVILSLKTENENYHVMTGKIFNFCSAIFLMEIMFN